MFKLNDILICCQEYVYNTEVIKPANVNPEIHYNRLFYSKELSWFIVEIIPYARNTFYPLDPCLFYILDQILELIMSFRSFMILTLIPSDWISSISLPIKPSPYVHCNAVFPTNNADSQISFDRVREYTKISLFWAWVLNIHPILFNNLILGVMFSINLTDLYKSNCLLNVFNYQINKRTIIA